jgi:flagellar protein FliL
MPPTRTEPAPAPDEAAPAAAPAAASATASGGAIKAWLPLGITVLMMPVLAYAMTSFVLLPRIQSGIGMTPTVVSAEPQQKKASPTAKKESVLMNKLLVNVSGTMGSRYLLVSLSLSGADPDLKAKLQDSDPQLRDMACGALSSKTLADLEKPGARNLIRSELLSGFNNILGGQVVQEIYLTEFAIQ